MSELSPIKNTYMNSTNGENHVPDSHQERVRGSNRNRREGGEAEVHEEEMLRAIEREHKTITVITEAGDIVERFASGKNPFPARCVEYDAIEILKKLERDPEQPRFRVKRARGWDEVEKSGYGKLLYLLADLVAYRVKHFIYEERIEALIKALEKVEVIKDGTFGPNIQEYVEKVIPQGTRHLLEYVLVDLQKHFKSKEFKRKKYARRAKARRIEVAFGGMFRRCLTRRGRILILRVDLRYVLKDGLPGMHPLFSDQCPDHFAMEVFIRDRDRFINNVRDKARKGGPFEHMMEWGWKQECGEKRGWHAHCVFIFDASKVKNYWYYGMQLADLWARLTEGRGHGFICRKGDRTYKSNCLGEVRRGDIEAEQGFKYLSRYFSLDDQMPVVLPSKQSQNYGITRLKGRKRGKAEGKEHAMTGLEEVELVHALGEEDDLFLARQE
ncbi:MAG TPA: hypothetical protein DF427_01025 [Moraxellaceae bacterium]|nr:hypothetical protein [Moraxellaceae bacterium]